jgi:hypothetical protein
MSFDPVALPPDARPRQPGDAAVSTFIRRWSTTASLAAIAWRRRPARRPSPRQLPSSAGGQITIYDTVLTPHPGSDSSLAGYVVTWLPVPGEQQPGRLCARVRRFIRRGDSVFADTARSYTIDPVAITLTIDARDSP